MGLVKVPQFRGLDLKLKDLSFNVLKVVVLVKVTLVNLVVSSVVLLTRHMSSTPKQGRSISIGVLVLILTIVV